VAVKEGIRRDDRDIVDEIISRMHSYETDLGRFVDREGEAREILGAGRGVIRDGNITILYGPKGCGKTTLFVTLISSLVNSKDRSVEIHYVSMDDARKNIVFLSTDRYLAEELSRKLGSEGFRVSFGVSISPFPLIPAGFSLSISKGEERLEQVDAIAIAREAIDKVVSEGGGGYRHVVVVDEYRLSSPEDYGRLKKHIETFYNVLEYFIMKILRVRDSSMSYIITTSDASVVRLKVEGSKEGYVQMWNLQREASDRIAKSIGVDENLAWRLAGGNPRALKDIRDYGVEAWIKDKISITSYVINRGVGVREDKIIEYLEYVKSVDASPNTVAGSREMLEAMMEENILILMRPEEYRISEIPSEPWIGKRYAFQIPAYYYILKTMAKRRSIDITPEEVIREAMA